MKTKLLFLLLLAFASLNTQLFSQWSTAVDISPTTTAVGTNENAGQCIAVAGDTVRVTYSDRSSAMVKIMYNQSHDKGITWGTPVELFSSLNCGFTAIATSGSSVHIVWMDSLGSTRASYYKRSLDGGATWDSTVCLDTATKFWPGIACSGNLVIATLNKDLAGNTEVFVKRSLDNGTTWLPEQQISNAVNRSEDPAINILGNDVHLSWNDKRSGTMNIYYCHSSDGGASWGPETQLTTSDSYTSMVCLNGNHVDVPHAIRSGTYFDIWLAESADTGATFIPNQQLSFTSALNELYPFMVRDSMQMHIVYIGPGGVNYLHSADGGLTWDAPVLLGPSGQPFIAYTGCVLHVIFSNGGHLNYMRNPTGNGSCSTVGIAESNNQKSTITIFPNPFSKQTTINFSDEQNHTTIKIMDILGKEVNIITFAGKQIAIKRGAMPSGIYFMQITDEMNNVSIRKVVIQ